MQYSLKSDRSGFSTFEKRIWSDFYLIVELLSPGTEAEDLGQTPRSANKPPTKWQAYEQYLR